MNKEIRKNNTLSLHSGTADFINDSEYLGNRNDTATPDTRDSYIESSLNDEYGACVSLLWEANPPIYRILRQAPDRTTARELLFSYLEQTEQQLLAENTDMHPLEVSTIRDCIRVFKNVIAPVNENRAGFSSLQYLRKLALTNPREAGREISLSFVVEFLNLFRGLAGNAGIYDRSGEQGMPAGFLRQRGRAAALKRTESLDRLCFHMEASFSRYPSGLDREVIAKRREYRERILSHFGGSPDDWGNYRWQLRHVIREVDPLIELIGIPSSQREAVKKAVKNRIPFGITPYYLSLMDPGHAPGDDHAIRAQVIPPLDYVQKMADHKADRGTAFDFMGEHDTSPVDLVTRRYPDIAILKPFNTCAQICVYCQRNWEIDQVLDSRALASRETIQNALNWFDDHKGVTEVLVTGGDPCIMRDETLKWILDSLSRKKQIRRIRIGTRTPVVLPMRWTDELVRVLSEFHDPGTREIVVVTHFEHSYEVTPEAMEAVRKIRRAGMGVYNQQVFTIENSRRFETVKLRRDLRLIGVDPYYTFNMKGKGEMRRYMVPIARLLQERKEEARLLPGLDRTDEPVFNVPRLGKNHLRALQDHQVIAIRPDGSRVYEFHPWEKNIALVEPFYYADVPILDYLRTLAARGEDVRDYRTIWYYF